MYTEQNRKYMTTYDKACLKEVRLGEPVTEGGREFHRVTACGAKEHIKYVVFELYGSSWRGL